MKKIRSWMIFRIIEFIFLFLLGVIVLFLKNIFQPKNSEDNDEGIIEWETDEDYQKRKEGRMEKIKDFFVSFLKTIFLWFWPSLIVAMIFIVKIKISKHMLTLIFVLWLVIQIFWFVSKLIHGLRRFPKDPTVEAMEKEVQ